MKFILILILLFTSILADKNSKEGESLELMYQSFIYAKDLPHAYKVAQKAIKRYPNSLAWHKKIADIAQWSGKNTVAMDHLIYLYQHSNNPKLGQKILQQMLASYQYKKALPIINSELNKKNHHTHKEIEEAIDIYDKVGRPEEAIKRLKALFIKNPTSTYLSEILTLQLEIGAIRDAKDTAKALESYHDNTMKSALALSKYYFLQKDLQKAYKILVASKKGCDTKNRAYFERLSDFSWYMGDEESALYAALILYKNGQARLSDLSHINQLYTRDDTLLEDISQTALESFQKKDIFLSFISKALEKKDFTTLNRVFKKASQEKSDALLKEDARFWLIKASVDEHFHNTKKIKEDLEQALLLSNGSAAIKERILWYLIDNREGKALADMVKQLDKEDIPSSLYHPLSAAYLTLQQTNKADYYLKKALHLAPNDTALLFLYSEILAAKGKEEQKRKVLKTVLTKLDNASTKNPSLLNDKQFIREYVQASLTFLSHQKASIIIESAKNRLSKKDYLELKMIEALKSKDANKATVIYQQFEKKDPFIELEIARLKRDKKRTKALLKQLSNTAPYQLKIEILQEKDKIQEAIKLAQEAQKENSNNLALQAKLNQLHNDYSSAISFHSGYQKRGDISIASHSLQNFYYLAKGYGIISKIDYFHYTNRNKKRLHLLKNNETQLSLGIQKHFKEASFQAQVHIQKGISNKTALSLQTELSVTHDLSLQASITQNKAIRDEGDIAFVELSKDSASLQANYAINDAQHLWLNIETMRYHDREKHALATGIRGALSWDYRFDKAKNFGMRLAYRIGRYKREKNGNSKISSLTNAYKNEDNLPQDYHDVGISLYYGNPYQGYAMPLQPYIDASLFYNPKKRKSYADILAGVTGSLGKEDLIRLGILYQSTIEGEKYKNYGMNLDYSHLY